MEDVEINYVDLDLEEFLWVHHGKPAAKFNTYAEKFPYYFETLRRLPGFLAMCRVIYAQFPRECLAQFKGVIIHIMHI